MNHKLFFTRGIILVLVILLTACAASKASPCPTVEAQSCPTSIAQLPPEIDAWRWDLSRMANVIFTFDPGDKCSMQFINKPSTAEFIFEIVVNDKAHLNYAIYGLTLNPGFTEADVDAWTQKNPNSDTPPPMMTMVLYDAVNPMSRTFHGVMYTGDPINFGCVTEGPDAHQVIADFDPLVMHTK